MKRILLSFVCALLFALPAQAEMNGMAMIGPGEGHVSMETGGMERMTENMGACLQHADKIGLTAEQVQKITPIHREMKKSQIRFQADLKLAEMEHMEIMEVKDFDLAKASESIKKIAELKTAHHLEMLKLMKEIRSNLTEEQFKKIKELKPMKPGGKKPAKSMKHKH